MSTSSAQWAMYQSPDGSDSQTTGMSASPAEPTNVKLGTPGDAASVQSVNPSRTASSTASGSSAVPGGGGGRWTRSGIRRVCQRRRIAPLSS